MQRADARPTIKAGRTPVVQAGFAPRQLRASRDRGPSAPRPVIPKVLLSRETGSQRPYVTVVGRSAECSRSYKSATSSSSGGRARDSPTGRRLRRPGRAPRRCSSARRCGSLDLTRRRSRFWGPATAGSPMAAAAACAGGQRKAVVVSARIEPLETSRLERQQPRPPTRTQLPAPPATQQFGGADLTAALHR
jgi:hypothetical protein